MIDYIISIFTFYYINYIIKPEIGKIYYNTKWNNYYYKYLYKESDLLNFDMFNKSFWLDNFWFEVYYYRSDCIRTCFGSRFWWNLKKADAAAQILYGKNEI